MITIHMEFPAHSLKRNISVKVLLPVDSEIEWKNTTVDSAKKFKTLYLLHGFGGDCSDWLLNTRVYSYAMEHNIAVVMPSGENKFYLDNDITEEYFSGFICKELIEITRASFPLSEKREDTLIGGLSMGGYGALCNGLKHTEIFGTIIAMSSALITDNVAKMKKNDRDFMAGYEYYKMVFGDPMQVVGGMTDPRALAKKMVKENCVRPNIYIACGTDDFVLELNHQFIETIKQLGIDYTYEEDPGNHDWDFWDEHIQRALDWYEHISEVKRKE